MAVLETLKSNETFPEVLERLNKLKETSDWLVEIQSRKDAKGHPVIARAIVTKGNFRYEVSPNEENGTTYSANADEIKDKKERARFLQEMCEIAVLNAKPGTKFSVSGTQGSEASQRELQAALDAALKKYPQQTQDVPPLQVVPSASLISTRSSPAPAPKPTPPISSPVRDPEEEARKLKIQEMQLKIEKIDKDIEGYKSAIEANKPNLFQGPTATLEAINKAKNKDFKLVSSLNEKIDEKNKLEEEIAALENAKPTPPVPPPMPISDEQAKKLEIQEMNLKLEKIDKDIEGYKSAIAANKPNLVQGPSATLEGIKRARSKDDHLETLLTYKEGEKKALKEKIANLESAPGTLAPPISNKAYFDPILGPQGGYAATPIAEPASTSPAPMTPAYQRFKETQPALKQLVPQPQTPELSVSEPDAAHHAPSYKR